MKTTRKFLGLVLAVVALCVLFVGCKDATQTVTGITFKAGEEPRSIYVQGQNLDLSSGTLTVVKEDTAGNESVSLSAAEVMVSGYDANKLGKQTVTVTYGGFTTTFEVTVVSRVAISGYKTDYMIGEEFSTKGSVTIAKDDGTTKSLTFTDPAIKIEGFDSSEETSNLTLTVTYNDGGTTHTGTFTVNVKLPEEVKIILPTNKIAYSHQTLPDLKGAQIVVTFAGKQSPVKIDESMISGFDPTQATIDHMKTPLEQTVTISYAGVSKSYTVEVYFSGVSLIKQRASEFGDVEFDEENSTIEPDEVFGPQAIEAMKEYYKLSNSDKLLISTEEIEKVVRHAVAYGRVQLANATRELSNTFVINDGSFLWMMDGGHADAVKAYAVISDDSSEFVTLGRLLYDIKEDFKDTVLVTEALVGSNVPEAYSDEELDFARELLSFILELHDQMAEVIPVDKTDWTKEDLNTTKVEAAITSIVGKIMNGEFSGYNFVSIYQMLSTWRANDDYFDIIYSYYYYGGEEKQAMIGQMFQVVPLPKLLQDIYAGVANGYFAANALTNGDVWSATEGIFSAYKQVQVATAVLEVSGSDFCKELYEYLGMEGFVENNLIFDNDQLGFANSYHSQVKEMYGDKTFLAMWNKYLAIYDMVNEEGMVDVTDPATAAAAAAILEQFVEMSPSWQYSFIASMHSSYREIDLFSRGSRLAFDYSDGMAKSNFVYLLAVYLEEQFIYVSGTDENGNDILSVYPNAQEIAQKLFRAMEMYSLRNRLNTARAFGSEMEEIEILYAEMGEAEKEVFDSAMGYVYEKYIALWKMSQSTQATEWGTYASTVEEMLEALKVYFQLEAIINNPTMTAEQKSPYYPLLFAAYEKAAACHEILNAIDDESLRYAYYQDQFEINEELTCPLEHGLWKARSGFINMMLTATFTVTESDGTQTIRRAWDMYDPSGVQPFMAQAFYVMATQYAGGTFDAAKTLAVMEAYRTTDIGIVSMFYSLGCDKFYYEGITSFMNTLANDTKALGSKLLRAEKAYMECFRAGEADKAEKLEAFKTAMEEAIALKNAVTSTEEYGAYLEAMYEFYYALYTEAITA